MPVEMPELGVVNDNKPEPFVCNTCPLVPSDVGNVNIVINDVKFWSYACTSVPIARPRFVRAVDALARSDKLFADARYPLPDT